MQIEEGMRRLVLTHRSTAKHLHRPKHSRRQLLQLGLAAGAGLLSVQSSTLGHFAPSPDRPRVIVVGAGFAGLACAFELASIGYAVKVLEARRRVGGRVLSLKNLIPGKNVEGGGEFIGSNHSHVLAYAAKFGLEFLDISEESAVCPIILEGRRLSELEIEEVEAQCETAYRLMTDEARLVNADEPWITADAERLDHLTTAERIARLNISELAKKLLTVEFTADNGVATDRQSYLANLAQVKGGGLERYWTDTELYRLKGGNQQIALEMVSALGDQHVELGCPVREIVVTGKVSVAIDAAGVRHEADDIVLAIPPSTWSYIQFSPELPETLSPQMGSNVKFLSVVQEPFWRKLPCSPDAVTDGDISETWHGTEGQSEQGPVALLAFSGGPAAETIHRRAVAERQPAFMDAFEAILPGYSQHFLRGQMMDWISDRWTKAGYSFPAPGQVTTIGPILRKGLDRLHFAGEHCCCQFIGYMEGALHSGASLAQRIARRDGYASRS